MGFSNTTTEELQKNFSKELAKVKELLYCIFIWLCLIFIFLPVLLPIFIPLYLWKFYILPVLAKVFRHDLIRLLDGYDGILAVDPMWSNPYSTLIGFITVEGSLNIHKFRQKVLNTILKTRTSNGQLVYEKMTYYPVPFLGYFFWKPLEDLSQLSTHFKVIDNPVNEDDLKRATAKLIRAPFQKDEPLWDITIYTNYDNSTKTALQIRCNHVIGDGMSCLKFFHKLCDYEQPPLVLNNNYKKQSLRDKLFVLLRAPATVLHLYWDNMTNSDIFNRRKMQQEYLVSWTTFPSEGLKLVRSKTNVHFSSIGLSLFGGSLMKHFRQVLNKDECLVGDNLRIMLPLPWPDHPNHKMVNHWTASFMKVPTSHQMNGQERLHGTNQDFWDVLYSGSPQFCRLQPPLLCLLPYPILKLLVNSNFGMGLCFTSIPGMYQEDLNLLGHRVVSVLSQCGPQYPQTGILASLFTYRGNVGFGITANKQLIPTQESLDHIITKLLQLELQEILNYVSHPSSSSSSNTSVLSNVELNNNNSNCILSDISKLKSQ